MPVEMLNVRDTARELGVHENTVRNWHGKGILRGLKLPGSGFRRFPREEIERMRREMVEQYAPDTLMPPVEEGIRGRVVEGDLL